MTGAPQTLRVQSMLMVDGGPEKIELTSRMYRFLAGLQGRFGRTSWDWETAAMIGGVRATDVSVNAIRDSRLVAAARRTDATAWSPFPYTFKVVNGAVVADQPYRNPASVRATYTGATVAQATFDTLGGADYLKYIYNNGAGAIRELGDPQYQVNLGAGYRFGRDASPWVRQSSVRLGVNNVLDDKPSRRADRNGYSGSIGTSLWVGRAYSISLTRGF